MPIKFDKHLKEVALIGSAKRLLDVSHFPSAIQDALSSKLDGNTETLLLHSLSLNYYYQIAGNLPLKYEGEIDNTPINEEMLEAPSELAILSKRIIETEIELKDEHLWIWSECMTARNFILPANLILLPLMYIRNSKYVHLQERIIQITGNRGLWIMKQSASYFDTIKRKKSSEEIWQEGDSSERLKHFVILRNQHIKDAQLLLRSGWEQESIKSKESFLVKIMITIHPDDLEFLEELYYGEFTFRDKEKKLQKECRRLIAACLLSLPASKLHQETVSHLKKYVIKNTGFFAGLTGKKKIQFKLPTENDDFFNSKVFDERFGIEVNNTNSADYHSDQLYWFQILLKHISIESWNELFQSKTEDTIHFFLEDEQFVKLEKGERNQVLIGAFLGNISWSKNQELISAIAPLPYNFKAADIISLFNQTNWESYVIKHELYDDPAILQTYIDTGGYEWSISFTKSWLKKIINDFKAGKPGSRRAGELASIYFNSKCEEEFIKFNLEEAPGLEHYDLWKTKYFAPITESLYIRSILNKYIK